MTDHTDLIVHKVVQVQVPPEQEHAAHAGDVAALPPGPEQVHARDALFAHVAAPQDANRTADPAGERVSAEEQQAAAAMVLLYAQQLLLTHGKAERKLPEPPQRPRLDENDSDDA